MILEGVITIIKKFLADVSNIWFFLLDCIKWIIHAPLKKKIRVNLVVEQIYTLGIRATGVILLVMALVGLIIVISLTPALQKFGITSWTAKVLAIAITKEIGPLTVGLVMCGFAGASVAAHVGTMNLSEELMALYTSAINPIGLIVVPRIVAIIIIMIPLTIYADTVGIVAGMLGARYIFGIPISTFYQLVFDSLEISVILYSLFKSAIFGIIIGLISCYQGFRVEPDAASVGFHTTKAVVKGMVTIISFNLILSIIYYQFFEKIRVWEYFI